MGVTIRAVDGGVEIPVRAAPRAERSELAGIHGDELRVRLAAPPVDGAANDELRSFFAGLLGVAPSGVTVVRGASSRSKVVRVLGVGAAEAAAAIRGGAAGS